VDRDSERKYFMKSVRAKFNVISVIGNEDGSTVDLQAVTTGSEENESFFNLTPAGHVTLSIVNPETASFFKQGESVFVDFTQDEAKPVDAPEVASV